MVGGHPIVVLEITKNEVGGATELSDVLVVGWSVANSLAASPAITLTFFPPLAAPQCSALIFGGLQKRCVT